MTPAKGEIQLIEIKTHAQGGQSGSLLDVAQAQLVTEMISVDPFFNEWKDDSVGADGTVQQDELPTDCQVFARMLVDRSKTMSNILNTLAHALTAATNSSMSEKC